MSLNPDPNILSRPAELIRQIGHGGKSILKTGVMRRDRLSDREVDRRLAVCRMCPGGHAQFRKDGRLKSCGKLLGSDKKKGRRKSCGCILRHKARDIKEDCPLGYWPVLNQDEAQPVVSQQGQATSTGVSGLQPNLSGPAPTNGTAVPVETWAPECDTLLERASNGRTRRLLDVENRLMRLQARRQRLAEKQNRQELAAATNRVDHGQDIQRTTPQLELAEAPSVTNGVAAVSQQLLGPNLSLYDFFDRVVVVNLDRRPDRMDRLRRHLAEIDWPFRYPERFRGIDGRMVKPPRWWRVGGGAWGCHQSHVRIIEQALMDDLDSILILEDDAFFEPDIRERAQAFLSSVPDDWQQIYLGGQHLFQRRQPPIKVNDEVVRPFNVNRTHAFALHRRGMRPVYRWLTDYVEHSEHPRHHVDHRLGALHGTGEIKVYAPDRWLAGQFESHSNIKGQVMPTRLWNGHRVLDQSAPFVAVIGLHRSGSSCLAGVLHKLGVHMGDKLVGYESTGGFEAVGLTRLCEKAYPFPSTELKIDRGILRNWLSKHVCHVQASAKERGTVAGGKYPHLCAMGGELQAVCGEGLRVIHINRPLDESIASMKTRAKKANGWLGITEEKSERVQRWLWEQKQEFLDGVEHLTVEYADLIDDPSREIDRIVEHLGITPSEEQRRRAIEHVQPHRRKHIIDSLPAQHEAVSSR